MRVLAVNSGSATLKCAVFDVGSGRLEELGRESTDIDVNGAVAAIRDTLAKPGGARALDALGHRVVHVGRQLVESGVIDGATERAIDELSTLAPLHNPVALAGIRALRELVPDLPMAALFDTAFHASRADTSS